MYSVHSNNIHSSRLWVLVSGLYSSCEHQCGMPKLNWTKYEDRFIKNYFVYVKGRYGSLTFQ